MRGKPFMVRLPSPEIRDAYKRYCTDHLRSLDAQSSLLIMRELKTQGYLNDFGYRSETTTVSEGIGGELRFQQ